MTMPCRPVIAAPKQSAIAIAGRRPSGKAAMKTIPLVDNVTPSENDMMLPLSVMKVMPTATQPMKDVVFSSEKRLTAVKKPGVVSAATIKPKIAKPRIKRRTRACAE